jgi:hypothetical protein
VGRSAANLLGNVKEADEILVNNIAKVVRADIEELVTQEPVTRTIVKNFEVSLSPFAAENEKVQKVLGQFGDHVTKAMKRPSEILAAQEKAAAEMVQLGIPEPIAQRIASATSDPMLNQARATLIAEASGEGEQIMQHTMQALAESGISDAAAQKRALKAAQAQIARHRRETQRSVRELEDGFKRLFGTVTEDSTAVFDLTATVGDSPVTSLQVLADKAQQAIDRTFRDTFYNADGTLVEGLTDDVIEALDQVGSGDARLALIGVFEKEQKIEREWAGRAWQWLMEPFDMIELGDIVDHYENLGDLVHILSNKDAGFGLAVPDPIRAFVRTLRGAEKEAASKLNADLGRAGRILSSLEDPQEPLTKLTRRSRSPN